MDQKKNTEPQQINRPAGSSEEPVPPLVAPDDGTKPYIPRPKYQIVTAWILLVIVVVGVILWLLEIGTGGSLFGLLD